MIVLGIDEAGYGPLLGPLVVAGSAFRVADGTGVEDFAGRLASALEDARLVVGDSKRVFGGAHDLATLETPVLAMLAASGAVLGDLDGLLGAVGVDPGVRGEAPWYGRGAAPFPVAARRTSVDEGAARVRDALAAEGIEFVGLAASVVPERRLNGLLDSCNKAEALFGVGASIFDRLAARRAAGEEMTAVFDRQGGRHYYATVLQRRWPQALAWPLAESASRSDYRVHFPEGAAFVRFEVEADGTSPHVGLASMLAKYLREVFMGLFNAHFATLCPGVAPTAGYVEDGRRWLAETRAARAAAGVPDSDLVRRR
jgi:hypothetical protein